MNRTFMIRTAIVVHVLSLTVSPALALAQTSPTTAPAAGGGVSVRPVQQPGLDASKSFFELRGAAGATLQGAVEASNTGQERVDLIVSSVDGLTGETSGSVFANRQDSVRGAGSWVIPSETSLELAPGASTVMSFTVRVPSDAPVGDHLAGLAFENADPKTSEGGFQIKQVLRTVIGVLVVVPGPAAFHPTLTSLDLTPIGTTGIGSVTVGLGNDGRALGKPDLTVALAGPDGYRRSVTRTLDTVLPSAAIRYPFQWPDSLPEGDYDITATLTGGGSSTTITQRVTLGASMVGTSPGSVPTPSTLNLYWLAIILVGAVAVGLLGGRFLRRRPRRPADAVGQDRPGTEHQEPAGSGLR